MLNVGSMKMLLRPWYHRAFRLQLRTRLWLADHWTNNTDGASPPLPPALLRYRVSESLDTDSFLAVGKACAEHIATQLTLMHKNLTSDDRVLDFGCGCGRTLRWLMNDFPKTHFSGADVDADAIQWCTDNLHNAQFALIEPTPPYHSVSAF
jgi:ribosomal protein L11 methylase PrmA